MRSRIPLALTVLASSALLTACYVVPIDPRTGQGYPIATTGPNGAPVVIQGGPPQPQTITVRLYPLNERANQAGLVTATVADSHTGRGAFTLNYLGDVLQGEATRTGSGSGARRGVANAYGPRGVNAQCDYVLTAPALGTGTCQFSDGAKYQMHFGS